MEVGWDAGSRGQEDIGAAREDGGGRASTDISLRVHLTCGERASHDKVRYWLRRYLCLAYISSTCRPLKVPHRHLPLSPGSGRGSNGRKDTFGMDFPIMGKKGESRKPCSDNSRSYAANPANVITLNRPQINPNSFFSASAASARLHLPVCA